ncbi:copper chaperone PCu(A)C [Meiothermus hypogaeus]|uniref:Transporter n=2 Tax=Meiothermus hypogaeus TaxID=884155 RepID=A0A511QZQ5_9DEIN|nr:copper chaperone PCu(A)C [Meiothermus hypogaeus]RIH77509.1 Copper chaperone PCu(A)C [Meiothermus hypogaeus]GEM82022.1 transporter [Meiothermus hypogaeus NBRC 106114]GIW35959.1 MAG: transporter [Meiothermus sp.]
MRWLSLLWFAGLALAQPTLRLEEGWVRRVPGNITAAYLVLYNPTDRPLKIVGASTPIATRVEFHQTTHAGHDDHLDISAMKRVDALTVPAKGRLKILPGGYHLMLYGLREKNPKSLAEGQKVPITLRLEGGVSLTFTLTAQTR